MKQFFITAVLLLVTLGLYAQVQNDVTLVVNGQGNTREEATANALRSAIEQSYGVFVSANTQILNDEIVKDEIATVASGNVKEYKELSCITMPDGSLSVTLSAIVSVSNLISYAKNHGSSAEFAGQTFAMNVRMRKLNTENELKSIIHLRDQVAMMARNVYDYSIEVLGEPKLLNNGSYEVRTLVTAKGNGNFKRMISLITSTLQSLSLPQNEVEAWSRNNMKTTTLNWSYYNIDIPFLRKTPSKTISDYGLRRSSTPSKTVFDISSLRKTPSSAVSGYRRTSTPSKTVFDTDSLRKTSTLSETIPCRCFVYSHDDYIKGVDLIFNQDTYFFRNDESTIDIVFFDITRFLTIASLSWSININDIDVRYFLDESTLDFQGSMTDFMMKGTLISNKKNSLCNTASLDLQWMGVSAKSPFDFELPIPTPILCIPVTFQLSEEELFNTRGFEVKYDSQFYDINSKRSTTEIYLNPSKKHPINNSMDTDFWSRLYSRAGFMQTLDNSIADDEVASQQTFSASNPSLASKKFVADNEADSLQPVPFQLVEEKPSFNGGDANAFSQWVNQRLVYPEEAKAKGIEGRVVLEFTIDVNGTVKDVKVLKGLEASLDAEAVKAVSMSPKWTPGKIDGKLVAVAYRFPVIFQTK